MKFEIVSIKIMSKRIMDIEIMPITNIYKSILEFESMPKGIRWYRETVAAAPQIGGKTGWDSGPCGAAAAQIEALSTELEVTEFDRQALIQEVALAEKNWTEFLKYYLLQNELLKERVAISEQSLEELELRLKAGRADVSKLAREILSKAQSEIALVQLKARYLREKVNAEAVTGQTCSLFSLCDTIKNSLPTNWWRIKLQ